MRDLKKKTHLVKYSITFIPGIVWEFLWEAGFFTRTLAGPGETQAGLVIGVDMLDDLESLSIFSFASSTVSTYVNTYFNIVILKQKKTTFFCVTWTPAISSVLSAFFSGHEAFFAICSRTMACFTVSTISLIYLIVLKLFNFFYYLNIKPDFFNERLVVFTPLIFHLELKLRVLGYQHLKVAIGLPQLPIKVLHAHNTLSSEDPPGQRIVLRDGDLQGSNPSLSFLRILCLEVKCFVVHSDSKCRVVFIINTDQSSPESDTPRS